MEKCTLFEAQQCSSICRSALWEYSHRVELLPLVRDRGLALKNLLKRCLPAFSIASLDKQALEPSQDATEHRRFLKFSFRAETWVQRTEEQVDDFEKA